MKALTLGELDEAIDKDAFVLDARDDASFKQGFIPGSIFIGLEKRFEDWVFSLIPVTKPICIVAAAGDEEYVIDKIAGLGYQQILGFLEGGFETYLSSGKQVDLVIDVEADELALDIPFDENLTVVDVRKSIEYAEGHVLDAVSMPLSEMADVAVVAQLGEKQNIYVHSTSGYRSLIAVSLLKKEGFHNVREVAGGWEQIKLQPTIKTEKDAKLLN